jgi:hypothetical protein
MGQMLIPAAIGAGIGAVGGAAMGKNPLKTALLGAGIGAGGAGLFSGSAAAGAGAGAAQGAGTGMFGSLEAISPFTPTGVLGTQTMNSALTGFQPALGMAGEQFVAQNAPMFAGQGGMFDVAGTQNQILGGIGQQTAMGGGGFDPSLMGSVQRGLESGYGTLSDWAKANPMQALSTTGQVVQAVTPQEQQQQQVGQPAIPPVTRGTYNTAPTLGQGQNERVASRMQVTPNQLNLYPSFYRGGF